VRKIKIGDKQIGQDETIFIIAEVGSNHDGKLEQAKKLIDIAAWAKVDAVKFQLFRASKLYPPTCGKILTLQGKIDVYKFFEQVELPYRWLPSLKKYAENQDLIFIVTPFDEKSADVLEKIAVDIYKIASPELNHLPLLQHIAKKQKPMILSSGKSRLFDIEEAIDLIHRENNHQVILLQCVGNCPAPLEDYNLNVIETFKRAFRVPVGISDHSLDPSLIPKLAVACGVSVVEKHFTLNKKLSGLDHPFALEPDELKSMVKEIKKVEKWSKKKKKNFLNSKLSYKKILGTSQKIIAPSEKELYPGDKRSIFVIKDIKRNEKLGKNNIAVLRGERHFRPGIHSRYFNLVLGKRATKSIKKYTGLQWEYLLTV